MTAKNKKGLFTAREIADSASNLVVRGLKPVSLGDEIPEARLRKLRAYSQAALAPMLKHMEEETEAGKTLIAPEELVMVLATAALFVQLRYVLKTDKLPASLIATDLYEGPTPVDLPEETQNFLDETPKRTGKPGRKTKT